MGKLNGKNVLFGIIGKFLELAFYNYKPSLKRINVNIQKEKELNVSDFYEFTELESIENEPYRYYLKGKNKDFALNDIKKIIDIYNSYLLKNNIKNIKELSVDNLIESICFNNKSYSIFNIRYTPLTPTGKIAKNICSLSFSINTQNSPYLKNGIMYTDEIDSSKYNDNASGSIIYSRDGEISSFSIVSNKLSIKGKNPNDINDFKIELF